MMSWHFTRLLGILRIATQIVWRNLEPGSKNQCHRSQFFSELRSQYKNKIAMSRFQNKLTNSRSNFTSFSCYVASHHRMYAASTRAAVIFMAAGVWLPVGLKIWRGGSLCVVMGFYVDIFWDSRCNIGINV